MGVSKSKHSKDSEPQKNEVSVETPAARELQMLELGGEVQPEETEPFDSFLPGSEQDPGGPLFNVISLHESSSRRNSVRESMKKGRLRFRFHTTSKDKEDTIRGIVTSHKALYQKCVNSGAKWIAVCEDNLILPRDVPADYFDELKDFVENNPFDIIYLGAFFIPNQSCTKLKEYRKMYKTDPSNIHGGMSYIISSYMCKKLLSIPYRKKAIDIEFLGSCQLYIYRKLLFHRSMTNSTHAPGFDKFRQFWFKPYVYKKCEDLFFNNFLHESLLIVVIVALFLLVILIWVFYVLARKCYYWWYSSPSPSSSPLSSSSFSG